MPQAKPMRGSQLRRGISLKPLGTVGSVANAKPSTGSPPSGTNEPTSEVFVKSRPVCGSRARRVAVGQVAGGVNSTAQPFSYSTGAFVGSNRAGSKLDARLLR